MNTWSNLSEIGTFLRPTQYRQSRLDIHFPRGRPFAGSSSHKVDWRSLLLIAGLCWISTHAAAACDPPEGNIAVEKVPSVITDAPVFIPVEDKIVVLRMMQATGLQNYESLKTWTGTYTFQEEMYLDDAAAKPYLFHARGDKPPVPPLRKKVAGSVGFKTDIEHQKLFVEFQADIPEITEATTGNLVDFEATDYHRQSIIAGDEYLHFQPNIDHGRFKGVPKSGPQSGRAAFRDPIDQAQGQLHGYIVDPRQFFDVSGKPFWSLAGFLADRLESASGDETGELIEQSISVRWDADPTSPTWKIILAAPGSRGSDIEQTLTVHAASGVNVTDSVTKKGDGRTIEHTTWKYENSDGHWLPVEVRHAQPTPDGEKIYFERSLHLTESKVNESIAETVFTLDAFGLKDGDRFFDRVDYELFVSEKGTLTQILEPSPREVISGKNRPGFFALILVTALVAGLGIRNWGKRAESV